MSVQPFYSEEDEARVAEAKRNGVAISSLRPEVRPAGWDVRWRQLASSGDTSFRMYAGDKWEREDADALNRLIKDVKAANKKRAPREAVLTLFLNPFRLEAETSVAPTLHAYAFEKFMPYVLEELKPGTQLHYAASIEDLIVQTKHYVKDENGKYVRDGRKRKCEYTLTKIGEMPLDRITTADIEEWYRTIRKTHGRRVCSYALEVLSSMLGLAVEEEIIATNPASGVKAAGRRKKKKQQVRPVKPERVVDPEGVELLRRYFLLRNRIRDWLMVPLLAYLGLRPGEVVVLFWRELVDEAGRALPFIQLERSQSGGVEVEDTKTGDWRVITVFEPVQRDIEFAYRAMGSPARDSRVCIARRGGLVKSKRWTRVLAAGWRELGLPHHCAYDLRHSAASYLGSGGDEAKGKGWDFTEIGEMLGHSPDICAKIYKHVVRFTKYRNLPIEQLIMEAKAVAEARLIGLDPKGKPIFADSEPAGDGAVTPQG